MWFSDRDWVNLFRASSRSIKGSLSFIINKHNRRHKKVELFVSENNAVKVNSQVISVGKRIDIFTAVNILQQSS